MVVKIDSSQLTVSRQPIDESSETVLPEHIASCITFTSLAARLSLRCSSLLIEAIFEAAKYGTSVSLGMPKQVLTNALSVAGRSESPSFKDVQIKGLLQVLEKYTTLGIYVVHSTFSLAELFAIAGLQLTAKAIKNGLQGAEESVRLIDGIFGSNQTSRAIAAIVTLVHREIMHDPEFELAKIGKLAILAGLTKALTAFAMLQNVTYKRMMKQVKITVLWQGFVTEEAQPSSQAREAVKRGSPPRLEVNHDKIIREMEEIIASQKRRSSGESTIKHTAPFRLPPEILERSKAVTYMSSKSLTVALTDDNRRPSSSANDLSFELGKENQQNDKNAMSNSNDNNIMPPETIGPTKLTHWQIGSVDANEKDTPPSDVVCRGPVMDLTHTFSGYTKTPLTMMYTRNSLRLDNNQCQFPSDHIVSNIARFMRYSSAAYGESFMRILGIGNIPDNLSSTSHPHHPNHRAFAHHTNISVDDILLSSYTDYSVFDMNHPSIHALVHYIAVDHTSKSVVLTCRGTLGLSDVLTDLTCGYTEFPLPTDNTRVYKAHSGMLNAAKLLAEKSGKVYQAISEGLRHFPGYGLVLCGHSLGAGVASLLGVLWSEETLQSTGSSRFVTSISSGLPTGRPIHCYAYAPPCCMSLELSEYCGRGLTTSIVHGYDVVSSLSIGLLKDFKNVAMSLHRESNITDEIVGKIIGRYHRHATITTEKGEDDSGTPSEDEQWFWALIKTMRADMCADKLYPPSTIYHIESVLQPSTSTQTSKIHKVTFSRCDDVQARFSEIVFSRTMFMDHSPNMYEDVIEKLRQGYFGETSNNKS
ncbi:hypothetical protein EC973_004800 [Apophysomyces ossiformis]|uniref:sn-1-specific diacylglycerol lipase n=1 Tax=Apophysomyces ossiformis TaxID=679940 RepID=A0A8H7BXG7_9FUNG|nr:hypothetical protein EC973_004800 [Apophysomyces ossiformis]